MVKCHDNLDFETEDARKHRIEEQENVLILFRMSVSLRIINTLNAERTGGKLREGISSSGRADSFSVEGWPASKKLEDQLLKWDSQYMSDLSTFLFSLPLKSILWPSYLRSWTISTPERIRPPPVQGPNQRIIYTSPSLFP